MASPFIESWRLGPDNTNFYVRLYEAPSPSAVLVFVHGAAEHCGRYTEMHSTLAREHNISVFAYDLRGYGRTADDPTHKSASSQYGRTWSGAQMDDLEWAIQETHRECGDLPLFIMGCSFVFVLREKTCQKVAFWRVFLMDTKASFVLREKTCQKVAFWRVFLMDTKACFVPAMKPHQKAPFSFLFSRRPKKIFLPARKEEREVPLLALPAGRRAARRRFGSASSAPVPELPWERIS
ncbi:hypothetical protein C8F01DRAFT_1260378 [Mycena amicta]|nr:hypothetical protein C8F01DRAFT_1260378 [Mycena amicta]